MLLVIFTAIEFHFYQTYIWRDSPPGAYPEEAKMAACIGPVYIGLRTSRPWVVEYDSPPSVARASRKPATFWLRARSTMRPLHTASADLLIETNVDSFTWFI